MVDKQQTVAENFLQASLCQKEIPININKLLIRPYTRKRKKKKKQHKGNSKIQLQTMPFNLLLEESLKPSNSGKASWKVRPIKNTVGDSRQQRYGSTNHLKG